MKCQLCFKNEAENQCIDCGKHICKDCASFCELYERHYCIEKLENIVIYKCKGIFCNKCADFNLVHRCIECNILFCNAVLDKLVIECPKCKNKACPDCKEEHLSTCNTVFDREKELDLLFKKIDEDNK